MPYKRPQADSKLSKGQKTELLQDYFLHYTRIAKDDPSALNRKIPRGLFNELLDQIGSLLIARSEELAQQPGHIRDYLDQNQLPGRLAVLLPDDFRVFCLALNALKQWVSAEQNAADRYLLGGTARTQCRVAATKCIVTETDLDPKEIELHHPVRDGRPPIPLSLIGHNHVEGQSSATDDGSIRSKLLAIKKQGNRSWIQLRRGCLELLGKHPVHSTPNVGEISKSFARKASKITGLSFEQLVAWLDESDL